jgi:HEPN domain-containing protein
MFNDGLASDYLKRAGHRLKALEVLMREQSWPDVVRESQELVEITLKALLRAAGIEVPGVHDVSPLLGQNREMLPAGIRPRVDELVRISRFLRRDRELAFYGSEDLTPSEFYTREDAATALGYAQLVYAEVFKAMAESKGE